MPRANRQSRLFRRATRFSSLGKLKSLFILLAGVGALIFLQVVKAQTIKADFQFQNTRNSSIGGSALTDTGAGSNTFQTDTVDGNSRQVLRFIQNNGLRLSSATSVIPNNSYTIVMLFKLDNVSSFRRLVDFKNRTTDDGLYIEDGFFELCQVCTPIPANTYVQMVFTRASNGTFAAYVNGTSQGSGIDSNNDFVIDGSNILNFFQDDLAFGGEASAGSVARIRLYDAPMSASEVANLPRLPLTTITVLNQNDSGAGSLRQAIIDANTEAGVQTINFNIGGGGARTISLASALPTITDPVIIDGTTQPGFSGTPLIELDGTNAGATSNGLFITAGNSTIKGLVINRFGGSQVGGGAAIVLTTTGNNIIIGNYLGTDNTGNAAAPNFFEGVFISNSNGNRIGGTTAAERNVISGNNRYGIYVNTNSTANVIKGNYIGTNAAGTAAVPNGAEGVVIENVSSNIIGGTGVGDGNVISGNNGPGLSIDTNANLTVVQGNFIGTNAAGSAALPNNGFGIILINAQNNIIGGSGASGRNVISGNTGVAAQGTGHGLMITDGGSTGNVVRGNYIGTDATGSFAIANVRSGIFIFQGATGNLIGGATANERNVVSGNSVRALNGNLDLAGIDIQADGNTVQGNYIGTNAAGTAAIANGSGVSLLGSNNVVLSNLISGNTGFGVNISGGIANQLQANLIGTNAVGSSALANAGGIGVLNSSSNAIGSSNAANGNTIAFNNAGIVINNGTTNPILSNRIFSNGDSGITLQNGANNSQAAPVLTSAVSSGGNTVIQGTLTSTPNTSFTIQFFSNAACDGSGTGEGEVFIGSTATTTSAGGTATFNPTLGVSVTPGQVVTATATSGSGNTSQFSQCRVVTNNNVKITGRVTSDAGTPLAGIALALSGTASENTSTDASGNYSFLNLTSGGNYTVTPSSASHTFSPVSHTFNGQTTDQVANFVATATTVNITGRVADSSNVGLNNVTISLTKNGVAAGSVQTDGSGNYSFTGLEAGASYVVTPTGTFTPSSQNLNNLTVNAVANFVSAPTVPPTCNTSGFGAPTGFGVGLNPTSVALADFNNDGKIDAATANNQSANASVLLATTPGNFGAATNFPVGTTPISLVARDFNNDGRADLAVANNGSNNVSILLATGPGTFGAATNFAAGSFPGFIAAGDFNNDGNHDLAVANRGSGNLSILLGAGNGTFSAAANVPVNNLPQAVAVGDVNNDGQADLIVPNTSDPDRVSVFLGAGNGTFGAPAHFIAGSTPLAVAVGDVNGDGRLDLAVANSGSNNVSILIGNGAGGFAAATNFAVGTQPQAVEIGDFNGDGKLDLAVGNNGSANISILLGNGTGGFGAPTNFPSGGTSPISVAVGDFNSDGKPDLAVTNCGCRPFPGSPAFTVLLNTAATCNTQTSLTISGQTRIGVNQPLSDVTVTLSGPITRVVQSDSNGNYSFPNLVPGGNYAVTVQSPHYIFAPSRADFFNLSSSQTANFLAAPVAVPLPTPPLSDNFSSPVRDATKWNLGTTTQPVGFFDPQVTTAQINGQLVITPLSNVSGSHFNGYVSANSFDLTNGKASVELVRAAPGGADTIFAIGQDSNNFYRFMVRTAGGPTSPQVFYKDLHGIERALDTTTSQLLLQVMIQGQLTTLAVNYNPVAHRFLRFRHESPQVSPQFGAIVFEASENGVDFTVLHRAQLTNRVVNPMTLELSAGTTSPTNTGSAIFDNVGLVLSTFQFQQANYSVGEGDGAITITVTRTGTLTDPATVAYETEDGTALQLSKFVNASGRLTFAPGEMTKTFTVLIINNLITEGNQTAHVLLDDAENAGLNSPGRALINIIDNDTTTATGNPLDDPTYFVTQQYFDFLNRLPDQGGLNFWVEQITSCPPGNQDCVNARRIRVSHAFFFEQEFQQTGAFVFRLYRAAFGNQQPFPNPFPDNTNHPGEAEKVPSYEVFSSDRAQVIGGAELTNTQLALANNFVQRPAFLTKYPANLDGPAFVTALLATIQTATGANLSSQQPVLQSLHTQGGRGLVMFHIANDYWNNCDRLPGSPPAPCVPSGVGAAVDNRPFIDAEYRRVFVTTQYFGYLRRDADIGGLLFWLNQVNRFPLRDQNIQNAMVCSFITSTEYQQRFSPIVTHTNQECQQ